MNRYIQKLINEQFNISNMNLDNTKPKRNANIFNKNFNHPYYYDILDGKISRTQIKELDTLVNVAVPECKEDLQKIINTYSEKYPYNSLNWLDVSYIIDMSDLFSNTLYLGDISKWNVSNV